MADRRKITDVTIGTDLEVFVKDTNKNEIISAEGLIGGTKEKPTPIDREGCFIQEDNVMAEFNVPPAVDPRDMYENIVFVLNHITNKLPEGFDIDVAASALIDGKYLETEQAQTFGCDPDYNIWTGLQNEAPNSLLFPNLRTCGGHVHVGYNGPTEELNVKLVKTLDLFLTVPSIIMDKDTMRRVLYGKSGSFRYKEYGVELRTLSNFWIKNLDGVKWMFNGVLRAVEFVNSMQVVTKTMEEKIVKCINNQDESLAKELIEKYELLSPVKYSFLKATV